MVVHPDLQWVETRMVFAYWGPIRCHNQFYSRSYFRNVHALGTTDIGLGYIRM